jgi:uridine phosphorylase
MAPGLELGQLLIAREAISADGTSRALGAGERVQADPALSDALERHAAGAAVGAVVTVDLFYERGPLGGGREALAVEMEAAALFALGAVEAVPVGCVLTVSDTFAADGTRARIEDQTLAEAVERAARAAVAALPV